MYVRKVMSRELYDWLVREKIADGALISKWRKPGYELLCSTLAINKGNHNFGTTSHCRVPLKLRAAAQRITPNVHTGCISCASGDGEPAEGGQAGGGLGRLSAGVRRAGWVVQGREASSAECKDLWCNGAMDDASAGVLTQHARCPAGKFGGPIWWNTPVDDEEETAEQNRATWAQPGVEEAAGRPAAAAAG